MQTALSQTGILKGTIREAGSNELIPFVSITLDDANIESASDFDGDFKIDLPEGNYVVCFSAIGFELELENVKIIADETVKIDVFLTELEVLSTVEIITVTYPKDSPHFFRKIPWMKYRPGFFLIERKEISQKK